MAGAKEAAGRDHDALVATQGRVFEVGLTVGHLQPEVEAGLAAVHLEAMLVRHLHQHIPLAGEDSQAVFDVSRLGPGDLRRGLHKLLRRGAPAGAYEVAHALAWDGKSPAHYADLDEEYDLVVVGTGISGLAAAYFYQQEAGEDKRILLLDNHDDFGGHARRNEFHYNVAFSTLNLRDQVYTWLTGVVVPGVFPTHDDGSGREFSDFEKNYMADRLHLRVGPIRLRTTTARGTDGNLTARAACRG